MTGFLFGFLADPSAPTAELIPNGHYPLVIWGGAISVLLSFLVLSFSLCLFVSAKSEKERKFYASKVMRTIVKMALLIVLFGLPFKNSSEQTDSIMNFFLTKDVPCDYKNVDPNYILDASSCKK